MPTPPKGPRLGGSAAHERLMLANLSAQLFENKSITTTLTKAKRLRPHAERLITFAKRGDLASRRRVQAVIASRSRTNKSIVHELFDDIAPAHGRAPGWLHPHHQDRQPQGRQRSRWLSSNWSWSRFPPKQAVVKEAEKAAAVAAPVEEVVETEATETAEVAETEAAEENKA